MKKYFWSLFSFFWSAVILYLSFFKPLATEGTSPWFDHQDKLGHFVFYGVLSLSLIKTFSQEIIITKSLRNGILMAFFFGIWIELVQHYFTTDRDGNFMDALANGMGAIVVGLMFKKFRRHFFFFQRDRHGN
ncbi:MAG: hypothetical protein CMC93_02890 [Flavobacteriaceae bacterium]|nr:hypothetical protein [Flavobacteriaceae bacterium]